jgi:hypothetical protein
VISLFVFHSSDYFHVLGNRLVSVHAMLSVALCTGYQAMEKNGQDLLGRPVRLDFALERGAKPDLWSRLYMIAVTLYF